MYIEIKKIIFFFEYITKPKIYYFNTVDYKIYNSNERQDAINSDFFEKHNFLSIPQKNRDEIAVSYLLQKNDRSVMKLVRMQKEPNFYRDFHWYTEDNQLVKEWQLFEIEELMKFAMAWCKENNIVFTSG